MSLGAVVKTILHELVELASGYARGLEWTMFPSFQGTAHELSSRRCQLFGKTRVKMPESFRRSGCFPELDGSKNNRIGVVACQLCKLGMCHTKRPLDGSSRWLKLGARDGRVTERGVS